MFSKLSTAAALLSSTSAVSLALEAEKGAKSCTYARDQILKGPSNSWTTFKKAKSTSAKFEDPEFGANDDSILWDEREWGQTPQCKIKPSHAIPGGRQWKRPTEMAGTQDDGITYDGKPSLWGTKGVQPMGIRQHAIGDCWALAAMSALAEVPERIERIFWNTEYDANGAFRIYFFLNSEWVAVNIDDRLPMYHDRMRAYSNQPQLPLGCRASVNNAWWVPILEKAFAKAHANYDAIVGGRGAEALRKMSGMPTSMFTSRSELLQDKGRLKKALAMYAEKNYPLSTGCCAQQYKGLVSGHAYTLLDYHKFKNGQELVKIRNPHASEKYKGDWRDNDPNWTAEMKAEIGGLTKADDGLFWMTFDQWFRSMGQAGLGVVFWEDYKGFKTDKRSMKGMTREVYTVTNPEDQLMLISFDAWGERMMPRTERCNKLKNNMNALLSIELYSPDEQQVSKSIWALQAQQSTLVGGFEAALPKGDYKMLVMSQYEQPVDFHVNYYWAKSAGTAHLTASSTRPGY